MPHSGIDVFWVLFGLGAVFGAPFLLAGIGTGIAVHGFKLFEIHRHYHYDGKSKEGE